LQAAGFWSPDARGPFLSVQSATGAGILPRRTGPPGRHAPRRSFPVRAPPVSTETRSLQRSEKTPLTEKGLFSGKYRLRGAIAVALPGRKNAINDRRSSFPDSGKRIKLPSLRGPSPALVGKQRHPEENHVCARRLPDADCLDLAGRGLAIADGDKLAGFRTFRLEPLSAWSGAVAPTARFATITLPPHGLKEAMRAPSM
jgi:hypothetical protein